MNPLAIPSAPGVPPDLTAILAAMQDQIDDLTATVEAHQRRIDDLTGDTPPATSRS